MTQSAIVETFIEDSLETVENLKISFIVGTTNDGMKDVIKLTVSKGLQFELLYRSLHM